MKKMKKIIALALSMIMVVAMSVTAFAAEVSLPEEDILKGHQFTAYQVFAGDEDKNVLSNVKWGSGINDSAFLAALKAEDNDALKIADTSEDAAEGAKVNAFKNCANAADVAKVLGENNDNQNLAKAVAKLAYQHKKGAGTPLSSGENTLDDGYYLIVDTTEKVGDGGVYNTALLQVVGKVNVTVKTDAPKVEKKVQDLNDSDGTNTKDTIEGSDGSSTTTDWIDSADYDIGDKVPFKLTATLPNNVSSYDTYKLVFHDTLSKGLTYLTDPKLVVKIDGTTVDEKNYKIETGTSEQEEPTLTVSFADVKVLGAKDNSVVTVEYSAELNKDANIGSVGNENKVHLEYSHKPDDGGEGTNNTPDDTVIVFTYKTIVDKIDSEYKPLGNAAFTLYKKFKAAPEGKNAIDTTKYPEYAGYYEVGTTTAGEETTEFTFEGIDDGDYVLIETTTPDGYNTAAPMPFKVEGNHVLNHDEPTLTELKVTGEGFVASTAGGDITKKDETKKTVTSGSIYTEVINNSGATLPETGGIGTTIFYVVGAILMIGAGVMLVTRKRISR